MAIGWRVASWISKATRAQAHGSARATTLVYARTISHTYACAHAHTHQSVGLTAFPRQQQSRERASVLRYTYIASLVFSPHSAVHAAELIL